MHAGPAIEAQSLQWETGKGCALLRLCFLTTEQGESQTLVRAPFAAFGSFVSVLPFPGGGPRADPHLGLGPLPSAPVGWEE